MALPDFEPKARITIELADIISFMVFPLVSGDKLQEWGEYSVANQGWYWEGMAIQEQSSGNQTSIMDTSAGSMDEEYLKVQPYIMTLDENQTGIRPGTAAEGPFFPIWQYSPQIPLPIVNVDMKSAGIAGNELQYYLSSDANRENIIGPAFDFEGEEGAATFTNLILERGGDHKYERGPLSYFYTPVYEKVLDTGSPLVAVIQALIYWQPYFEGLLPDKAQGIVAVLENDCNQSYTFGISGQTAEFLGAGDLHDSTYDRLEAKGDVFQPSENGSHSERAGGDFIGCTHQIRVYPSKAMEDHHLTNQPLIIALSLFGVFAFTTLVFLAYDRFVEKRQKIVLETAVQSTDVVHKLFPEAVRDRLYNNADEKSTEQPATRIGSKAVLSQFLRTDGGITKSTTHRLTSGDPIADEYKECTGTRLLS